MPRSGPVSGAAAADGTEAAAEAGKVRRKTASSSTTKARNPKAWLSGGLRRKRKSKINIAVYIVWKSIVPGLLEKEEEEGGHWHIFPILCPKKKTRADVARTEEEEEEVGEKGGWRREARMDGDGGGILGGLDRRMGDGGGSHSLSRSSQSQVSPCSLS